MWRRSRLASGAPDSMTRGIYSQVTRTRIYGRIRLARRPSGHERFRRAQRPFASSTPVKEAYAPHRRRTPRVSTRTWTDGPQANPRGMMARPRARARQAAPVLLSSLYPRVSALGVSRPSPPKGHDAAFHAEHSANTEVGARSASVELAAERGDGFFDQLRQPCLSNNPLQRQQLQFVDAVVAPCRFGKQGWSRQSRQALLRCRSRRRLRLTHTFRSLALRGRALSTGIRSLTRAGAAQSSASMRVTRSERARGARYVGRSTPTRPITSTWTHGAPRQDRSVHHARSLGRLPCTGPAGPRSRRSP